MLLPPPPPPKPAAPAPAPAPPPKEQKEAPKDGAGRALFMAASAASAAAAAATAAASAAAAAANKVAEKAAEKASYNGPMPFQRTTGRYVHVASKQLVGVHCSVWVKRELAPAVSDVRMATVSTGLFFNMLGNKGAAAVMMRVHESPLCFIAAHLTSGEGEQAAQKRSADFQEITAKVRHVKIAVWTGGKGGALPAFFSQAAGLESPGSALHLPAAH